MEREAVELASGCNLWATEDNTGHHSRKAVEVVGTSWQNGGDEATQISAL